MKSDVSSLPAEHEPKNQQLSCPARVHGTGQTAMCPVREVTSDTCSGRLPHWEMDLTLAWAASMLPTMDSGLPREPVQVPEGRGSWV